MAVRLGNVDITGVNRAVDQSTLDAIGEIEHHFGHAGPAFVHRLIRDGHLRNPEELRRQVNRAAGLIAQEAVGTRIRAATPFALLSVAGELAKALAIIPAAADVRKAVLWAWERYLGSSEAVALGPAEQVLSHLRTWIVERWDVTVKSVDAAWDDPDGRRVANLDPIRALPILRVPGTGREPELSERQLDARRRVHACDAGPGWHLEPGR